MSKTQSIAQALGPKRAKRQPRGGSDLQSVKDRCTNLERDVAMLKQAILELTEEVFDEC